VDGAGRLSYNDWTERIEGPNAAQNPTRADYTTSPVFGQGTLSGPHDDGGQIAPRSSGSGKGDLFYSAKWQLNANGFYQLGGGWEVGANVFSRQGYVDPYIFSLSGGADASIRVLATPHIDDVRYPNLWDFDLRVANRIRIQKASVVLAVDGFNMLNAGTVLQRNRNLGSSVFDAINEIISPRIFRLSAKLQF
jgi:hypothetical protein